MVTRACTGMNKFLNQSVAYLYVISVESTKHYWGHEKE